MTYDLRHTDDWPVHFHHSDDRFCGTTQKPRRFTTDPNEVTCVACQALDTFEISDAGRTFLTTLQAET